VWVVATTQVSSDFFARATTAATRLELLETRAHYRTLQSVHELKRFCQRVYEKWMDMAVMSGSLRLPGFVH